MARLGKSSFSKLLTGVLLATIVLPELLLAVPLSYQHSEEDGSERAEALATSRRLVRNRRNISWYKQHSDFWNWYKFFSDSGNQDGVAQLDQVYLSYLQNKNRAESQRSYKLYLQHLGEIYKSCAESDDPNCVASYTSRQKPNAEAPRPAAVRSCDPFRDPYCPQSRGYAMYPYAVPSSVRSSAPAPAPVKTPAFIQAPSSGYPYYAPVAQSFLSPEQKAELLHICGPDDVECLQYHLRGAFGHKPAGAPAPSYAHLGCDPKTDPYCVPQQAQKAALGMYRRYPNCDPRVDPYCAYSQKAEAPSAPLSSDRMCNPLIDENCNPLTATRFASLATSSKDLNDDPASGQPSRHYDPYSMYQDAAATSTLHRSPSTSQLPQYLQPQSMEDNSHPYGPPGKNKEGYDCFIGYDAECYPVAAQNIPSSFPNRQAPYSREAYAPQQNNPASRTGVIEPDPDCDPEYDRNCRLRRYEPEAERSDAPARNKDQEHGEESRRYDEAPPNRDDNQEQYDRYMSGQEDPYATYGPPDQGAASFQDMLRAFGGRIPGQDDHRAYSGDYKKK